MTIDLIALVNYFKRISPENVNSFTKQTYFLLSAGVPLYRSIKIIENQTKDLRLKKVLKQISIDLSEGKSLTESLSGYPESFSGFYISMLAVGESRGELAEALSRIHKYLDGRKELSQKIVNALTYPIILMVIGMGVLLTMLMVVLPKFTAIFETSKIPLPGPTKFVLAFYNFFSNNMPQILLVLVALAVLFTLLRHDKVFRVYLDRFLLKVPLLGDLLLNLHVAGFCRTLGIMLQSGIQLLNALQLSQSVLVNYYLQQRFGSVIRSVRDGKGLSFPLSKISVFPDMMSQMISVGEESGSLDSVLIDVATFYEQESDYKIKRLMSLVEPMALIFVSLFVALVAAAVILPMFRMSSLIHSL